MRIVLDARVSIRKIVKVHKMLEEGKIIPSLETSEGDGGHRQGECMYEQKG